MKQEILARMQQVNHGEQRSIQRAQSREVSIIEKPLHKYRRAETRAKLNLQCSNIIPSDKHLHTTPSSPPAQKKIYQPRGLSAAMSAPVKTTEACWQAAHPHAAGAKYSSMMLSTTKQTTHTHLSMFFSVVGESGPFSPANLKSSEFAGITSTTVVWIPMLAVDFERCPRLCLILQPDRNRTS